MESKDKELRIAQYSQGRNFREMVEKKVPLSLAFEFFVVQFERVLCIQQ
jgi:hypothetical protein